MPLSLTHWQADKENAIGRSETGSNGRKTKYFSNVGPKQVSIQKNKMCRKSGGKLLTNGELNYTTKEWLDKAFESGTALLRIGFVENQEYFESYFLL
ncbi:hypothetical protein IGI04_020380 [Brassica rapa subsp. trilocularis]|uniref:Uncharacterized protein n=1 Tax=Brassica rapa subsp. trilocularis TaxID=1813537 RepID=A0ABQ7MIJ3_BRACM|nr:hypothetical protein IGI04_020380 [Brassica rapa subsp. trilocularis]